MDKEKMQKKIDYIKYKFQKNGSIIYYITSSFICLGLVFFLSSNLIFNKESSLISSALEKPINLNNVEIKINKRQFNPKNNLIQFNIKLKNFDSLAENNLYVELREKKNPNEIITTNLVKVSNEDYIIYSILPPKWSAVSLTFINKNSINGEKNQIKFYSDFRDITINEELKQKNKESLNIELVDDEIKKIDEEIENFNVEIENKNEEIKNINSKILSLESEKEYETESELATTEANIISLKTEIEYKNREINNLTNKRNELNKKIEKLNKKKENLYELAKQ